MELLPVADFFQKSIYCHREVLINIERTYSVEEGVRSHARQYPGAIPAGYEFPPLIEDHRWRRFDGGAKTPDNSSDKNTTAFVSNPPNIAINL
ncbi:MAG: hypothetical protein WBA77_03920 [Microcoleaceae cyanobacterium]